MFVAQKALVRALAGEDYLPGPTPPCSAKPLFKKYNLLPVFCIYLMESCKFVRKFPHYFVKTREVHAYSTREKSDLYVPVQTCAISEQNPLICVSRLYNNLPANIREETRFREFQASLRKFVYHHKFYDESEYLKRTVL